VSSSSTLVASTRGPVSAMIGASWLAEALDGSGTQTAPRPAHAMSTVA
jgi:hypothetical protein